MPRSSSLLLLAALSVTLSGCPLPGGAPSAPAPVAPANAPAPIAPADPVVAPVAATLGLDGVVKAGTGMVADAAVTARVFGQAAAIATATTDAAGHFRLALPATIPAGTVLRLTATREAMRVATLVTMPAAPAARRVLDGSQVVISWESTLAFLALAPRLAAAHGTLPALEATVRANTVEGELRAFSSLEAAAAPAIAANPTPALGAAIYTDLRRYDDGPQSSGNGGNAQPSALTGTALAAATLAALGPQTNGFARSASQQAEALGLLIKGAVAAGAPTPASELLAQASFAGQVAAAVTVGATPPAGGGSSGGSGSRPAKADGDVAVTDGDVTDTADPGFSVVH